MQRASVSTALVFRFGSFEHTRRLARFLASLWQGRTAAPDEAWARSEAIRRAAKGSAFCVATLLAPRMVNAPIFGAKGGADRKAFGFLQQTRSLRSLRSTDCWLAFVQEILRTASTGAPWSACATPIVAMRTADGGATSKAVWAVYPLEDLAAEIWVIKQLLSSRSSVRI